MENTTEERVATPKKKKVIHHQIVKDDAQSMVSTVWVCLRCRKRYVEAGVSKIKPHPFTSEACTPGQ